MINNEASQIREIAAHYTQDIPLKEGYELWGTATGSIPYHRKWWILKVKEDEVISYLDQGCYYDPTSAVVQRREWAFELGVLGKLYRRNPQTRNFQSYDPYDVPFVQSA